jgi:membrane protein YdbS with pleckstrin-like domain
VEETRQRPEERDVWWGAFAARSLTPAFLVCALLTGLLYGVLRPWGRLVPYTPVAVLWGLLLAYGFYRVAGWNYRLTTRRLFRSRGFRRTGIREVELARVAHVLVQQAPWQRLLKVGTVRVVPDDGSSPLLLEAVGRPEHVALLIRKQVELAREHPPADAG